MLIRLNLQNALIRRGYFVIICVILILLVKVIVGEFVVGTLSDKRVGVNKDLLDLPPNIFRHLRDCSRDWRKLKRRSQRLILKVRKSISSRL